MPDAIEETIRRILTQKFEVPESAIHAKAAIRGDLGLESLEIVEFITALHKAFGYNAPMDAYRGVDTLGRVVAFVRRRTGR